MAGREQKGERGVGVPGSGTGGGGRVSPARRGRPALAGWALAAAQCTRISSGRRWTGRRWAWIGPRPFTADEAGRLSEAARFAAAPLAALDRAGDADGGARDLSRPAQRRAGAGGSVASRARRDHSGGAAVRRSARLHGSCPKATPRREVISALDAWFDRIAGAVHAFGGEVLKFIGDGVLAIFPVAGETTRGACDTCAQRRRRRPGRNVASRRGATTGRASRLCPLGWRFISARSCGATSAPPTGSISRRSAPPSIW